MTSEEKEKRIQRYLKKQKKLRKKQKEKAFKKKNSNDYEE